MLQGGINNKISQKKKQHKDVFYTEKAKLGE